MIDFHSHILPEMDDGSQSVEESLALLSLLAEQGIKKVVATPHFYANDESVETFLERRRASYEKLKAAYSSDLPALVLGAEVKYYQGISRMENLNALCIEGTNLLLLEMSASRWTDYTMREIHELSRRGNLQIILAHVERYIGLQSRAVRDQLEESDILMQVNADLFSSFIRRRKALKLLGEQRIHLIGSDCHGLEYRPPQIGEAIGHIRKKFGEEFLEELAEFEENLLDHKAKKLF